MNANLPIARVLGLWPAFAQLPPGSSVRAAVERFVTADSVRERRLALAQGNLLFRLQEIYAELGIGREDVGVKAKEFEQLLEIPRSDIEAALRGETTGNVLIQLQQSFEFGRGVLHPKHESIRLCLLELWSLQPGGPSMKYAVYPNGVLYSGAGKTHEEMARSFVAEGYGAGVPSAGGQVFRKESLTFDYDVSSTAFRSSGMLPAQISATFQRWIRNTGADESKVKFAYAPSQEGR